MSERAVRFQGSIPENYEKYLVPLIFNPYAKDMALRIDSSGISHVLELAAGTGAVSRILRDWLPADVKLTITDLNEPMLDICKRKFEPHENAEFYVVDAMEIPYADNAFDAVVCQFGVMFFPDRQHAYSEISRVLKPGGEFIFNVWDRLELNSLSHVTKQALLKRFPKTPPTFFETPFGSYNIEDHREHLHNAGFGELTISVMPKVSTAPNARHVAEGYLLGSPLSQEILEINGADPADAIDDVTQNIAREFGDSPTSAPMQAIVFEARLGG